MEALNAIKNHYKIEKLKEVPSFAYLKNEIEKVVNLN